MPGGQFSPSAHEAHLEAIMTRITDLTGLTTLDVMLHRTCTAKVAASDAARVLHAAAEAARHREDLATEAAYDAHLAATQHIDHVPMGEAEIDRVIEAHLVEARAARTTAETVEADEAWIDAIADMVVESMTPFEYERAENVATGPRAMAAKRERDHAIALVADMLGGVVMDDVDA